MSEQEGGEEGRGKRRGRGKRKGRGEEKGQEEGVAGVFSSPFSVFVVFRRSSILRVMLCYAMLWGFSSCSCQCVDFILVFVFVFDPSRYASLYPTLCCGAQFFIRLSACEFIFVFVVAPVAPVFVFVVVRASSSSSSLIIRVMPHFALCYTMQCCTVGLFFSLSKWEFYFRPRFRRRV